MGYKISINIQNFIYRNMNGSRNKKGTVSKPGKGMSKSARRRAKHKAQDQKNAEKWFFESKGFKAGPLEVDAFGLGSGNAPKRNRSMQMNSTPMTSIGMQPKLGYPAFDAQVVMPTFKEGNILCGTEFLTSVNITNAVNAGDILYQFFINPSRFGTTRLAQFAPLFQRYRFLKFELIYEPIANATQSGQFIGYTSYDVDNPLTTDGTENIAIAAANYTQRINQVWQPQIYPFGVLDNYTTLFTSLTAGEERLISQGVFNLIAASSFPAMFGAAGNIYIRYECEFNIPQLNPIDTSLEAVFAAVGSMFNYTPAVPLGASYTVTSVGGINTNIINDYDSTASTITLTQVPLGYYMVFYSGVFTTLWSAPADQVILDIGVTGATKIADYPSVETVNGYTGAPGLFQTSSNYNPWAILEATSNTVVLTLAMATTGGPTPARSGSPGYAPNIAMVSIGPVVPPTLSKSCKFIKPPVFDRGIMLKGTSDKLITRKVELEDIEECKKLIYDIKNGLLKQNETMFTEFENKMDGLSLDPNPSLTVKGKKVKWSNKEKDYVTEDGVAIRPRSRVVSNEKLVIPRAIVDLDDEICFDCGSSCERVKIDGKSCEIAKHYAGMFRDEFLIIHDKMCFANYKRNVYHTQVAENIRKALDEANMDHASQSDFLRFYQKHPNLFCSSLDRFCTPL